MTTLSKEEYLKRYLNPSESGNTKKKKRKKKASTRTGTGMKIFDDDVPLNSIAPQDELDDVENKLLVEDEKPLIEEIDNRTDLQKKMDDYRSSGMWKSLGADEEEKLNDKNGHDSDGSDQDLPREHARRHDSDSDDMDVPRRNHQHSSDSDTDIRTNKKLVKRKGLTKRRKRHDSGSNSDHHSDDSDLDIPRGKSNQRNDSDSDLEPPRKSRTTRHDSDSDLELPRNSAKQRHNSGSDMDLPRKNSTSRKRHDSDSDLDVPRPSKDNQALDSGGGKRNNETSKMLAGGKGGLTSVDSLRKEIKQSRKKESDLKTLANQYKNETTVYRERGSGKKRNLEKENEEKQDDLEKRRQKEVKYDTWGKGLKQTELIESAVAEALHESSKPLARYADDEDLERIRREAIRDGDPMAEYINRKNKAKSKTADLPKYRGPPAPPNRFGILPGYRWDGVDRSTGFEKKYFDTISNREANKNDFYKWSVNDM